MLDKLDDVDWSGLTHAYGSAANVPGQIRALASSVRGDREAALRELYGNIYHQGDRYPATPHAIPFLFELVFSPEVERRAAVLNLITHLVAGDCTFRNGLTIHDGERALFYGRPLDDEHAAGDDPWIWRACYDAALPFVERVLELGEGEDGLLRLQAAHLLGCFRPLASMIAPRLTERLGEEEYDNIRATQIFALHRLDGPRYSAEEALTAMLPSLDGAVGAVAAMCVANLARDRTSTDVVRCLRDGLARVSSDKDEEELYASCPFGEGFAGDIGHVVDGLGHDRARTFVLGFAQALSGRVDMLASMGLTSGMLRSGFAKPYEGGSLRDIERAALAALFYNEEVWRVGNNHYALKAFGIPSTRAQVGELLGLVPEDMDRAKAALGYGLEHCHAGRLVEALPLLEEARCLWPQQHVAWVNVAWTLHGLERFDEAASIAARALEVFFDYMPLYGELANALLSSQRLDEAVAAASRGLERVGDDPYVLYTRACAYARLKRLDEAIADLQRLISLDATRSDDIEEDTAFEPLRPREDFQALLGAPAPLKPSGATDPTAG